ncbi:MAG: right-handed parallel beta-helix repeat-containing protein, partial [Methermicoccaceae archaeon]
VYNESGSNATPMYRVAFAADFLIGWPNTIGIYTLPEFVSISNHELRSDLVLTIGDCFDRKVWYADQFLDIMQQLAAPWVFVWGNHECGYDGKAPIELQMEQLLEAKGVDAGMRRYGELDIDGDGRTDFLLVIFGPFISEDDLSWFKATFASTTTPIIVLQHIPTIVPDMHVNMRLPNAEEVMRAYEQNGHVFAVFSCHDHGYSGAVMRNGTWYVNVRRLGTTWGVEPGYAVLDFYRDGRIVYYTKKFYESGTFDHTILRGGTDTFGFTVELECTPESLPAYSYLLDKGVAGNRSYGMCIKGDGAMYAVSHDEQGEIHAESTSGLVHAGESVHAIMVANSTRLVLYVNGKEVAQAPAHPPYTTNHHPLYIGRTYSHPFNGTMRSVRLYDIPLTPQQVASHFAGSYADEEERLVLHYEANESVRQAGADANESVSCDGSGRASFSTTSRTYITSLPYEISSSGYYVLDVGCTNAPWDSAITINSSDVVLDGNGNTLEGRYRASGIPLMGKTVKGTQVGVLAANATNITIRGLVLRGWHRAIYLNGCSSGQVEGNTLEDNGFGVLASGCEGCSVSHNKVRSSRYDGIALMHSPNGTVESNTLEDNGFGVFVYWSNGSSISQNEVRSSRHSGIYVYSSVGGRLEDNVLSRNGYGVCFSRSSSSLMENNTFEHDGMCIWNSSMSAVVNNTVNGKRLVYLENEHDMAISSPESVGQLVLNGCENITVEQLSISNTTYGIELWKTGRSAIRNSTVSESDVGIFLLYSCKDNEVVNNTLVSDGHGIYLNYYSQRNTLSNNTVLNGTVGLWLFRSDDDRVHGNTISGCSMADMYVHSSKYATITSNTLSRGGVGLRLNHSRNNTISHNTFLSDLTGLSAYHSEDFGHGNNTIFLNDFVGCGLDVFSLSPRTVYSREGEPAMWLNTTFPVPYTFHGKSYTGYLGNHHS